jgi:hypothetical protein
MPYSWAEIWFGSRLGVEGEELTSWRLSDIMGKQFVNNQREQLRTRLRQLILLRETGPKSAAWHAARVNLIWRLHAELARASEDAGTEEQEPRTEDRG